MVIMNGFIIDDTDANSLKIRGTSITNKERLREYLNGIPVKTKELIGDVINLPDNGDFNITINKYEDIVLVIIEDNKKNKCYYLFDEEMRYLNVISDGREIELKSGSRFITNLSLDDSNNTSILVNFINYLGQLQKNISFNLSKAVLCSNLRIFDEENSKIITEDKEIILAQPKFYKDDIHEMRLCIISKKGLRVVGYVDCLLKSSGESNFDYRGNVEFNILQEFLNIGYERKALKLLKKYIDESPDNINKVLYLAGTEDDELITSIAVSNGGKLAYDGEVPKSEPLNFVGKIKSVRVYRIG